MNTTYRLIGLLVFLTCFSAGGDTCASADTMSDEHLKDLPTIVIPELSDNLWGFDSGFAMRYAAPRPGIDLKIGKISPDPAMDYKIRIAGPKHGDASMEEKTLGERPSRENPGP